MDTQPKGCFSFNLLESTNHLYNCQTNETTSNPVRHQFIPQPVSDVTILEDGSTRAVFVDRSISQGRSEKATPRNKE